VILPDRLPAASPRRVRERLAQTPDGPVRVVHRGPHALYLDVRGRCVGVVDADAAQVPCALRTPSLAGVDTATASVRGGVLHLGDVPVRIGRLVGVEVPRLAALPDVRPSSHRLAADPGQRVTRLVGAGGGLTPYGDDVLCGWLAVHRAAGVATPRVDAAVRASLHRTTLLSATLLDCALHGEVLPQFAAWVATLGSGEEAAAAEALLRVGHSSGRGLLTGARQGLGELAAGAVAA
jgi:hypothetical protein